MPKSLTVGEVIIELQKYDPALPIARFADGSETLEHVIPSCGTDEGVKVVVLSFGATAANVDFEPKEKIR